MAQRAREAGRDQRIIKAMRMLRKMLVETLALVMLSVGLAYTANAVRGSGSIQWTKNYFDTGADLALPKLPEGQVSASAATHAKHRYQEITFDELAELFNDPTTDAGLNVLIDARNDEQYESGHIPGAIQCDPYNLGSYIDEVLAHTMGAMNVIVYCGGGECEDSVFMCRELLEADVPYDAIHLFAGGWEEWTANGMPIEEGRREP